MNRRLLFIFILLINTAFALEPVIIVLGTPGSGKGTFSQFLKENYQYNHLSAGDIVRREIDKKTLIGLQIADIVKRGEYINTQIMQSLITQNIYDCHRKNAPFIIDGFGRTNQEIKFLYDLLVQFNLLSNAFVIFLDADDAICKERMSNRIICSQCEHIYNVATAAPIIEEKCNICSGNLVKRINDTPEIIEKKIREYRDRVEFNYKKALALFPHLFYSTECSIDNCMQLYQSLAITIANFHGTSNELVDVLKTHPNNLLFLE